MDARHARWDDVRHFRQEPVFIDGIIKRYMEFGVAIAQQQGHYHESHAVGRSATASRKPPAQSDCDYVVFQSSQKVGSNSSGSLSKQAAISM
jgi:hypothetical protein